jgi:uncharacterized membrane protein
MSSSTTSVALSSTAASGGAAMLCAPALTYLVISLLAVVMSWIQNAGNTQVYSAGHVSAPVQNTTYVFVLKIMWFLFWTWILNTLCNKGYKTVAWVLVAIPFLVFFTIMFGLANMMVRGSPSPVAPSPVAPSAPRHRQAATQQPNANEYVYGNNGNKGNKADNVAFYPNQTNAQYSSYASYDANLDNRANYLDRESKGLVQPQQPQQPQQPHQ